MSDTTPFTEEDLSALSKEIVMSLSSSLSQYMKSHKYGAFGNKYLFNVCKDICSSITYNQFMYYFNKNACLEEDSTSSQSSSFSSESQVIVQMEGCDDCKSHSDQLSEEKPHSCTVPTLQSSPPNPPPKPRGRPKNSTQFHKQLNERKQICALNEGAAIMWHYLKKHQNTSSPKPQGYWKYIASQMNEKYQLSGPNCIKL